MRMTQPIGFPMTPILMTASLHGKGTCLLRSLFHGFGFLQLIELSNCLVKVVAFVRNGEFLGHFLCLLLDLLSVLSSRFRKFLLGSRDLLGQFANLGIPRDLRTRLG